MYGNHAAIAAELTAGGATAQGAFLGNRDFFYMHRNGPSDLVDGYAHSLDFLVLRTILSVAQVRARFVFWGGRRPRRGGARRRARASRPPALRFAYSHSVSHPAPPSPTPTPQKPAKGAIFGGFGP